MPWWEARGTQGGKRRGRKQKCKEGGRNNNLKAMDLECIREEKCG